MYRVGFPGWKLAARVGVPLVLRVDAFKDEESNSFWAKSDDLDGLVVSGATLEELHSEVVNAAVELLDLEVHGKRTRASVQLQTQTPLPCAA